MKNNEGINLEKPQRYGKYFSFMPTKIKKIVEKKFNYYCKKI